MEGDALAYTSEDYEKVLAQVTGCMDLGFNVEMADDAGPTNAGRVIRAALRAAAAVTRPGVIEAEVDGGTLVSACEGLVTGLEIADAIRKALTDG